MILIKNAKILTMTGENYDCADILIDGTVIKDIGENISCDDAYIINAEGLTAMPGIIDPHCHIGMWEDGIADEGSDGNEATDPVTPELRAIDAINPEDYCFTEARNGGVTTVVTGPGSANVIGGLFTAIKTYGNCIDDMILKDPCALKVALGENPKRVYGNMKKAPSTRMANAAILRNALVDASNYRNKMNSDNPPDRNLKMETLVMALNGKIPVKVHAHRADDICTAIRIAKEFDLDITIEHCTEGYRIPEHIKKAGCPIIIGPMVTERCKPELKHLRLQAPKVLYENGIEFAIMSDHPVIPTQHLNFCAALAIKEGLPEEEALKALTINAAKACGIDDRVGSLEIDKDADIVLYAGDPLDIRTHIKYVLINGEVVKN